MRFIKKNDRVYKVLDILVVGSEGIKEPDLTDKEFLEGKFLDKTNIIIAVCADIEGNNEYAFRTLEVYKVLEIELQDYFGKIPPIERFII